WLDRPPSEIVRDHVLPTTQPVEEPPHREELWRMLETFDAGRMLMFSSDFPHWDGDTPDFAARTLPPDLRPRGMGEPARAVYGIRDAQCEMRDAGCAMRDKNGVME